MRIAVGSDHRGANLRAKIVSLLQDLGQEVVDVEVQEDGTVDYPDIAAAVARKVSSGRGSDGAVEGR